MTRSRIKSQTNLDCPSSWDGEVIPTWAADYFDNESWSLSGKQTRETIFALLQWQGAMTSGRVVTPASVRDLHNGRFSASTYEKCFREFAEGGLIEALDIGDGVYRIPDDRKLGDVFNVDNPPVRLNYGEETRKTGCVVAPTQIVHAAYDRFHELTYTQYVQGGDRALAFALCGVMLILVATPLEAITTTNPQIVVTWAALSFAISALAIGTILSFVRSSDQSATSAGVRN
ncbi:hypothetical protein [Halovenus halobia]|uniref:hypothetical protein n=1 Tax=Halovenus halobia TaxID=3396622 RepID=UPI003F54A4AD